MAGGYLDEGEWGVQAHLFFSSETVHHIIDAPARPRVGVQHVRFIRIRLKRQYYRISRAVHGGNRSMCYRPDDTH